MIKDTQHAHGRRDEAVHVEVESLEALVVVDRGAIAVGAEEDAKRDELLQLIEQVGEFVGRAAP